MTAILYHIKDGYKDTFSIVVGKKSRSKRLNF